MRVEEGFQQIPLPELNVYTSDPVLPRLLKHLLPESIEEVEPDLIQFGEKVITTIRALGSGTRIYPPQLVQFDQWGRRVDELHTSEGWRGSKATAQREGIPAIFYERKYREFSRIYGFAKVMLMAGDAHDVLCPLSMTDGAARIIELIGNEKTKEDILPLLISRDPTVAFTACQWMTERPGGSDVSLTETIATSTGGMAPYGPKYNLDGFKWFASATDGEVSMALARTGTLKQASHGLSLFLVPLRLPLFPSPGSPTPSSTSNKIFVHRLKKKIGTYTLPTAELSLQGAEGYLLGDLGKGTKNIAPVLNITRIWSSTTLLKDAPIHVAQLAEINLLYRALSHFIFGVIALLGRVECDEKTQESVQRRLRVLTPVVKAYTAEKACAGMEEAMVSLGGAGYMEENGFGRSIRDALVEKIWEGTATVLSLDLTRAAADPKNIEAFTSWARSVIASTPSVLSQELGVSLALLDKALNELLTTYTRQISPLVHRPALLLVGSLASNIYLLEYAIWSFSQKQPEARLDVEVFSRWIVQSGLEGNIMEVRKAKDTTLIHGRIKANESLVFGSKL